MILGQEIYYEAYLKVLHVWRSTKSPRSCFFSLGGGGKLKHFNRSVSRFVDEWPPNSYGAVIKATFYPVDGVEIMLTT